MYEIVFPIVRIDMKQTNKKAEINSGDLLSESLVISFTFFLLLPGLVA